MSEFTETGKSTNLNWQKWFLTPWTIVAGVPFIVLHLDPPNASTVTIFAIKALLHTLPYIIIAVLLIAWLKAAGAEAMVANAFKGREIKMIFLAAVFGGLAPFCSCEVIPFISGLLALGAPLSAVMAFWLSSPLIDPATLFITAGALGWPFAIAKAISAVSLGLFGGFAIKLAYSAGMFGDPLRAKTVAGCDNGCGPSPFQGKPVWLFWRENARLKTFKTEFMINGLFLIKWLALAYTLEALLVSYVPASLIVAAVGGEGVTPIITAAMIGMPAYLNGYVAPPLLAGLMDQGMTAGAAIAFLIAGSVSSIPAMAAVWSLVKPRVFFTYLGLGLSGAIITGVIFQALV